MRKELIILSGFLGSGKTTVLRSLLSRCTDRSIAVLVNDFGDVPVDGVLLQRSGVVDGLIVEIGGGSVFCACLRDSFVKAMRQLAERDEELVIVEASGMSDPATVDKMLQLSGLDAIFDHTATLCLFDPIKSLKLARVLEVIPRQLASASVAILTKADAVSQDTLNAAREYIRSVEPDLPVLESHLGNVDFSSLPKRVRRSFAFGFNTPETRPDCFTLETSAVDLSTLTTALQTDERVLRVKGYLRAKDGNWFVSDTGQGFEIKQSSDTPVPLTIICLQGTAESVRASLCASGLL